MCGATSPGDTTCWDVGGSGGSGKEEFRVFGYDVDVLVFDGTAFEDESDDAAGVVDGDAFKGFREGFGVKGGEVDGTEDRGSVVGVVCDLFFYRFYPSDGFGNASFDGVVLVGG